MRKLPGWLMNSAAPIPATGARPLRAKYRSMQKMVMPRAPIGTSPISTVRADSFSHNNEPMPVPTDTSARHNR